MYVGSRYSPQNGEGLHRPYRSVIATSWREKLAMTNITRAKYQAPKLEVQRLRDLPSALASSAGRGSSSKGGVSHSASSSGR